MDIGVGRLGGHDRRVRRRTWRGRTLSFVGSIACVGALAFSATASSTPPAAGESEAARDPRDIYVYPAKGQDEAQLDRDRYECHLWAVRQSRFDPSDPRQPPQRRVRIVRGPSTAEGAATGAMTGAVLGAIVSSPRHTGDGAIVGAAAGAILGGTIAASRQADAQEQEDAARDEESARRAEGYRRAVTACLDGRGYTVR